MKAVPLSRGAFALVDDDDYETVVSVGKWSVSDSGNGLYARREVVDSSLGTPGVRRTVYMHTFLTGWPLVDHANGMTLDNRRQNLRPATPGQNNANRLKRQGTRSRYRGVYWHKASSSWQARITAGRRTYSLRYHATEEAAARAYDRAAIEHHGEFARLNFPREDYAA